MKITDIKERLRKIIANKKKMAMWIILLICFPCATIWFLIWPSNLFGNIISKGWKIFWWSVYATVGFALVAKRMLTVAFLIAFS